MEGIHRAEIRVSVQVATESKDHPSSLLDNLVRLSQAGWESVSKETLSNWPGVGKDSKIEGKPAVTRIDIYDPEGRRVVTSRYFEGVT